MSKYIYLLLVVFTSLVSCTSPSKMVYLNQSSKIESNVKFETTLQPDDQLLIIVTSENPEAASPYNLKTISYQGNSENVIPQERNQAYIVDQEGNIEFPMLGTIKVGGLTRIEATNKIKELLKNGHISDPIVNVRLLNFKISVLGEVAKPGVYQISGERITLVEGLALAGDLTIYGKRNNILLIREKNGVKTYERIDITKTDFINSPNYYLSQNDVIYVEPNKTKINSSAVGPNLTIGISALSLVVTILALTIK
ncbi:polysaccharide biosynthesis/export family protein [Flavobacterium urocaniciphilum]|uniref:Polysaccharide export outer membrane protein n=1 Tax=Flavobacterium urocaniciphilum TaxID=1299341 RepID=A0A1H8YRG2_9FLAO|nr:polysaccharide biosynthesis/export family protein [Flavobacterium urocaniciphilum]SEP54804.1 polysaccharide export outer membrane protein [Flavobacterium urocaniciphilum]